MSPLFRSAAFLAIVVASQTGCAARMSAQGNGRWGATASSAGGCKGSFQGSGYGGANASGNGYGTAGASGNGYGAASASGTAYGGAGASANGYGRGGAYGSGSASGSGSPSSHGGAQGAPCGCAVPSANGGATATAGGGAMLPLPGIPQFYGIPLGGADDVIFVLDRSDSMSGSATGAPTTALASLATAGYSAFSAFQGAAAAVPTTPSAFQSALSAWGLGSAPQTASPSKMDAAKAELVSALSTLPDGTRFSVVFFNESVSQLAPGLTSMSPGARWTSVSFVNTIGPSGTTAAVPALRQAYAAQPRRVVFLSDGLANTGGDSSQLLAEARVAMRHGVRFDTVGVGADQDAPMLRAMAAESGGIAVSR